MSLLRRIMYAFWYLHRPPWDSGVTPPELVEFLKAYPVGRAIDLGCGTGTNAINMANWGWQVTGIDFVPAAINQARQKARFAGVNIDLQVGDVTKLDGIDGNFDFALDLGCFHSLKEKERPAYLLQLERVLKPGATWFLYAFLNSNPDASDVGLLPKDLDLISTKFRLVSRKDGFERGSRSSAYLIFERIPTGTNNG